MITKVGTPKLVYKANIFVRSLGQTSMNWDYTWMVSIGYSTFVEVSQTSPLSGISIGKSNCKNLLHHSQITTYLSTESIFWLLYSQAANLDSMFVIYHIPSSRLRSIALSSVYKYQTHHFMVMIHLSSYWRAQRSLRMLFFCCSSCRIWREEFSSNNLLKWSLWQTRSQTLHQTYSSKWSMQQRLYTTVHLLGHTFHSRRPPTLTP